MVTWPHGVAVLLGISCAALAAAPATGPLRVSERNPRYFEDPTGRAVYLAGAHDGWELQDYAWGDANPGVLFDWNGFLDFLEEYNHNVIRLWVVEHAKIRDDDPDLTVPMPYERVAGHGKANDGEDKFDLDQFSAEYFGRLRARVAEAGERGIYVIVMLYQGWSIEDKRGKVNPWPYHPFHRDNNVNGVDGDIDGDGQGTEMHTWLGEDHPITQRQRAYVRKVIDTVGDLNNVLYEIANETGSYSIEWHTRMIEYIREYEGAKGKQHPVGMTFTYDARKRASNSALFASPADWISPNREAPGAYDYRQNPPPNDGRKVVLSDTDHLWGNKGKDYTWVWKSFCRGHNLLYMDMWTVERGDAQRELVRKALGHTRAFAERMDLLATKPRGDLASSLYCLANPGREYLIYAPETGPITVDLSDAKGALAVEWFNPRTGKPTKGDPIQGGAKRELKAPFEGDAVLYITAMEGNAMAQNPSPPKWKHVIIDADGPKNPHTKTAGDVDGDGRADVVVASSAGGPILWYENPGWEHEVADVVRENTAEPVPLFGGAKWRPRVVAESGRWSCDATLADMDGDGHLDLVISEWYGQNRMEWYENPGPDGLREGEPWKRHIIGSPRAHDIAVGDIDGDRRLEIVTRQQGKEGDEIVIWRGAGAESWQKRTLECPAGEGLELADLNGDRRLDIIIGGRWYEAPQDIMAAAWAEHVFADWPPDAVVRVADMNGDGRPDVVLTRSEGKHRVSWFEGPADPTAAGWAEHIVDDSVDYAHSLAVCDLTGDGALDIVTAEMHQSDRKRVLVYLNEGDSMRWRRQIVADTGLHNLCVADIRGDGRPAIIGANWSGDYQPVEMWTQ